MNRNIVSLSVSPWRTLRLSVGTMLFQSSKRPGVIIFAFRLVALENGGCAALEGLGGFCCEGAVSRVVGDDGHEWSNGWEALSLSPSQRRLS